MNDQTPCPKGLTTQDQADIMATYDFQSDPCRLPDSFWRDQEKHGRVDVTLEHIIETKHGSWQPQKPGYGKAVVSWVEQRDIGTANNICIEAENCTLAEAQMCRDYLEEQGVYCGIN